LNGFSRSNSSPSSIFSSSGVDEQRGGLDGRLPRDFVDLRAAGAVALLRFERFDAVEVDVPEAVALLLVELDPRPAALRVEGGARNALPDGRVLVAVRVLEDLADVAGLASTSST
jgi:hypothetical protein